MRDSRIAGELWLVLDASGSIVPDGNAQSVRTWVAEALPHLRLLAGHGIEISAAAMTFDDDARWAVPEPVPLDELELPSFSAAAGTLSELGVALDRLVGRLSDPARPHPDQVRRASAVVVVSDGWWTDTRTPSATSGIARFDEPRLDRIARISVAVGRDPDRAALTEFASAPDLVLPLAAPQLLAERLDGRWSGGTPSA